MNYGHMIANRLPHFSGTVPKCIAMGCEHPGRPSHGAAEQTGLLLGDSVHFYCYDGYILEGAPETQCLSGGAWSHRLPRCTEHPAKLKGIDEILFPFRSHITVKLSSFLTVITVKFANHLPKIAAFFKIWTLNLDNKCSKQLIFTALFRIWTANLFGQHQNIIHIFEWDTSCTLLRLVHCVVL